MVPTVSDTNLIRTLLARLSAERFNDVASGIRDGVLCFLGLGARPANLEAEEAAPGAA